MENIRLFSLAAQYWQDITKPWKTLSEPLNFRDLDSIWALSSESGRKGEPGLPEPWPLNLWGHTSLEAIFDFTGQLGVLQSNEPHTGVFCYQIISKILNILHYIEYIKLYYTVNNRWFDCRAYFKKVIQFTVKKLFVLWFRGHQKVRRTYMSDTVSGEPYM